MRALGNYIDENLFKDVTIVETPEGFLIKGQVVNETQDGFQAVPQTFLFANDDIDAIIEAAYGRRKDAEKPR